MKVYVLFEESKYILGIFVFWEIRCIKWVDYKWVVLSIVVDILVSIWELKGYLYLRFNVIFFK